MDVVDHLVFSCSDLHSGIEFVADHLGVSPVLGGRHPQWGTHNALLSLGNSTYFEIIASDPGVGERVQRPEIFTGTGPGSLSTWAASLDDLPGRQDRARLAGHPFGDILEGSRVTDLGLLLEWSLDQPPDSTRGRCRTVLERLGSFSSSLTCLHSGVHSSSIVAAAPRPPNQYSRSSPRSDCGSLNHSR